MSRRDSTQIRTNSILFYEDGINEDPDLNESVTLNNSHNRSKIRRVRRAHSYSETAEEQVNIDPSQLESK